MSQLTFAEAEYEYKKRKTKREVFLERMDGLVPWKRLEKKIVRYYAKGGPQGGRPAYPLSSMLRVHCLQLFYNLSDPGMDDATRSDLAQYVADPRRSRRPGVHLGQGKV